MWGLRVWCPLCGASVFGVPYVEPQSICKRGIFLKSLLAVDNCLLCLLAVKLQHFTAQRPSLGSFAVTGSLSVAAPGFYSWLRTGFTQPECGDQTGFPQLAGVNGHHYASTLNSSSCILDRYCVHNFGRPSLLTWILRNKNSVLW